MEHKKVELESSMYKYKKIIYLFVAVILISVGIISVISYLEKTENAQTIQTDNHSQDTTRKEIYTVEDYLAFAESVNSGNEYQNCEVVLQSDLDFSDCNNLFPIGTIWEEGKQNGNLFNCVSTSESLVGEFQKGQTKNCYQSDYVIVDELNQNLVNVSGYYEDTDFCSWENGYLSNAKDDLLEDLTGL